MKTLKDVFEENYIAVAVPANNKKGFKIDYIYYAPWYKWNASFKEMRLYKFEIGSACLFNILLYLITSLQYCSVNCNPWVEVPAILAMCMMILIFVGVVQFCCVGEHTTKMTYDDINNKLRAFTVIHAALLAISVLGCIYVLIFVSFSMLSLYATVGYLVCATLSVYIFIRYRSIPYTTEKNHNLDNMQDGILGKTKEETAALDAKIYENVNAQEDARRARAEKRKQKFNDLFTDAKFDTVNTGKTKKNKK